MTIFAFILVFVVTIIAKIAGTTILWSPLDVYFLAMCIIVDLYKIACKIGGNK